MRFLSDKYTLAYILETNLVMNFTYVEGDVRYV